MGFCDFCNRQHNTDISDHAIVLGHAFLYLLNPVYCIGLREIMFMCVTLLILSTMSRLVIPGLLVCLFYGLERVCVLCNPL